MWKAETHTENLSYTCTFVLVGCWKNEIMFSLFVFMAMCSKLRKNTNLRGTSHKSGYHGFVLYTTICRFLLIGVVGKGWNKTRQVRQGKITALIFTQRSGSRVTHGGHWDHLQADLSYIKSDLSPQIVCNRVRWSCLNSYSKFPFAAVVEIRPNWGFFEEKLK